MVLVCAVSPAPVLAADPGAELTPEPAPRSPGTPGTVYPVPEAAPPRGRPAVQEGSPTRRLLGGTWYFRLDDANAGLAGRYMAQTSLAGWRPITLPFDWNAQERTSNRSSVGWFRRELDAPRAPKGTRWVVRFEGAGHFSTVYLNGRRIVTHAGNYLPFEAELPELRRGRNRLVVRISSLRSSNDLSHWRKASFNGFGNGGWWNFGGIHREVSIRPVRGVDIERVQAVPRLACPACAARVQVHLGLHNPTPRKVRSQITLRVAGRRIRLAPRYLAAGQRRELVTRFTIRKPKRWDIRRGNLYGLLAEARVPGEEKRARPLTARYRTSFGVRDLRKRADGTVLINGVARRLRGVSVHEDDPLVGSAWRAPQRASFLRRVDDLGANVVRAHYPLDPALLEALDRRGVAVWDAAPVYQVQNDRWALPAVRRNAVAVNREMVRRDRGHPSVIAWSIANELPDPVTPQQASFMRGAAAAVRRLDSTRLVAIDRVARVGAAEDSNPVLRTFDALGVNEYFGWYRGAFPPIPETTSADLGPYLDTLHRQQPRAALFVTEFGAEANRDGPVEEKGTFAFQARFMREHLQAIDTRPFVNGAMVWNVRDFRVIPNWAGGNPIPDPPYNHKGLLDLAGKPKPAYDEVKRIFTSR